MASNPENEHPDRLIFHYSNNPGMYLLNPEDLPSGLTSRDLKSGDIVRFTREDIRYHAHTNKACQRWEAERDE